MILVTGASTGIGFHTALRMHELGYTVWAGVRKELDKENLLKATNNSDMMRPLILDVTNEDHLQSAFQSIQKENGQLKALINNAGIVVTGPVELAPMERLREQFNVNVFAPVRMIQVFLPLLRESQGRIVNISSIAGRTVTPFMGPYCASKHALEAFSDALRVELLGSGVQVSLIEPGSIDTPIWKKSDSAFIEDVSGYEAKVEKFYGHLIRGFKVLVKKAAAGAASVNTVVSAIEHAVTSSKPKTRYLVGRDARVSLTQNILPDRWRDRLIYKYIEQAK